MEQKLLPCGLPKEADNVIMIITKIKTKAIVYKPSGNTGFFDMRASVKLGYKLAPYTFMICLEYFEQTKTTQMI